MSEHTFNLERVLDACYAAFEWSETKSWIDEEPIDFSTLNLPEVYPFAI